MDHILELNMVNIDGNINVKLFDYKWSYDQKNDILFEFWFKTEILEWLATRQYANPKYLGSATIFNTVEPIILQFKNEGDLIEFKLRFL